VRPSHSPGDVLVAGGSDLLGPLASAELYEPTSGIFTTKTLFLKAPRAFHTLTALPDGTLLAAGGLNCRLNPCPAIATAEIYNPATNQFAFTGSMNNARSAHTATLLNNGTVLVVGGWAGVPQNSEGMAFGPALASAELYNPATGTFSATGSLITARANHAAALLANGKVLITGGESVYGQPSGDLSSAEIYDPATGAFSAAGNMTSTRFFHTATLLPSGQMLIAGGGQTQSDSSIAFLATAELYDPSTGVFTPTGTLAKPPMNHTATLLANGQVFIGNGEHNSELYNPATGSFLPAGPYFGQELPQTLITTSLLPNGQILMAGGLNFYAPDTELYDPVANTFAAGDDMLTARTSAAAASLLNGNVIISGGANYLNNPIGSQDVDIYQAPYAAPSVTLTSVTPSTLTGFSAVTITLAGAGFLQNAVVMLDSMPLVTTYVSATQLTAVVPASEMNQTSNHTISVANFGGLSSNGITILIQNPELVIYPQGSVLNFGSVNVGGVSSLQSASINALGNAPLVVGPLAISGTNAADFSFSPTSTCPVAGFTLQAGTSCMLYILFAPTTSGALSAQIAVSSNAPPNPSDISLAGTGVVSPGASVSPATLSFGNQQVGMPSAAQSVTLTNNGNQALTISGVMLSTPVGYSDTNNCPATAAVGASCSISVVFKPNATGTLAATLTITDNAPNSPQAVQLSGTGITVSLGPSSSGSTAASVTSGQPATYSLQLAPTGGLNSTVMLSVNCASVPAATCTVSPASLTANSSAAVPFSVSVQTAPYSKGALPVGLSARWSPPALLSPSSLFGAAKLNARAVIFSIFALLLLAAFCASASRTLRGNASLRLSLAATLLLLGLAACGGSGTSAPTGTPPGTYNVLVTATSASGGGTLTLTLTVH
jgi:Abnormal spindle-like microcephaly-assoc'd, ASPM-SPD-2-Hydin